MHLTFPNEKRFAFTVFDDTDVATLEYIRPIYELLYDLGMRTTKTVWPLNHEGPSSYLGTSTMQDNAYYCDFLRLLQSRGFEIAYHGATMETACRGESERALALFREVLGSGPTSYAAHAQNCDNLYWGRERFRFLLWRTLYDAMTRGREPRYAGHVPNSPHYWLDLAAELRYVRSFTYSGIDINAVTHHVPYRIKAANSVLAWFPSCDADNVEEFVELINPRNLGRLEASRGVCILSTHFGKGFVKHGKVREDVARALDALSRRPGWFVPVTPLLDHLAQQRGIPELDGWRLFRLEGLWFLHTLLRRHKQRDYEQTEIPGLQASQQVQQLRIKHSGNHKD